MIKPLVVVILATCGISMMVGCGTVQNLRGGDQYIPSGRVYGGVRYDIEKGIGLLIDGSGGCAGLSGRALQLIIGPCLLMVDLPLSAVADTVTLPICQGYLRAAASNSSK
jgi:uncharacterized protein YceK